MGYQQHFVFSSEGITDANKDLGEGLSREKIFETGSSAFVEASAAG